MVDRIIQTVRAVLLAFGWKGLLRRLAYMAMLHSGWLRRRLPRRDGYEEFTPLRWEHQLTTPDLHGAEDDVIDHAEALLDGQLRFYGWTDQQVEWPPRWHRNVFTGHEYPAVHWTSISDNDPSAGDIKDVWEISRFTWVFLLARAYARTGDERWPSAFWEGLESWMHHNPPNTGVNWRCAQESSLRAIALQFGLAVFGSHPSTTPERRRRAGQLLEATRQRVRPTVGYALSQRNNHAISELCFLLTISPRDRRLNRLLRECLDDQFYADGSYSQQSPIYQRLAVHTLFWLDLVCELPPDTKAAIGNALDRSALFLGRIVDPVSCHAPNYGPNDGALLLDLDPTLRADFTPILDLLGVGQTPTESAAWLGRRVAPDPATVTAESMYVTLTADKTHVLMRCGTGRHRLQHEDQLAIDVWMHGENVIPDPGTYRYTAPEPWGNPFVSAEMHSRPRVPTHASRQIGRFLALPGPPATVRSSQQRAGAIAVAVVMRVPGGEIQRTVCVDETGVSIIDKTCGQSAVGRITHPTSTGHSVTVRAPSTRRLHAQESNPASGWISPHYGQRLPGGATEYIISPGTPAIVEVGRAHSTRQRLLEIMQAAYDN